MTTKITKAIKLGEKIIQKAKQELTEEREKELFSQAKVLLKELAEAKRTVNLLEKQVNNFVRECNL